jgi:hypothetical protein
MGLGVSKLGDDRVWKEANGKMRIYVLLGRRTTDRFLAYWRF